MKPGDVVDIRIGTRLNKTSMVMNGGVKPSGGHNQCSPEPDSMAMSQGAVDVMSIRSWAEARCFAAASKTPDVLTRELFHVWKKRQGILAASQSGRGHAIQGIRKAVLENLEISTHTSRNRWRLLESWWIDRFWCVYPSM